MASRPRNRAFVLATMLALEASLAHARLPRRTPVPSPTPAPAGTPAPALTPRPEPAARETPEPTPEPRRRLPGRPTTEAHRTDDEAPGADPAPAPRLPRQPGAEGTPAPAPGVAPGGGSAATPVPFSTPPGYTGRRPPGPPPADEIVPVPDRWRGGFPDWERYPGRRGEVQYTRGRAIDPYHQNVLKGDYPVFGRKVFLTLTGVSASLAEYRRLPLPSGVSTAGRDRLEFFGRGQQAFLVQILSLQAELFHGSTAAFKPKDWAVRATPTVNFNYLDTRERNVVNIDPRRGTNRSDRHVSLQEGFVEVKLADLSPSFDFVSVRGGIQGFTSDFRGFIFEDYNLGARLFGNLASNRLQFNVACFEMLEKDTNSGLLTFDRRRQQVGIGNLYVQDFVKLGYTAALSVHLNRDEATRHFDTNRFLVRPSPIGDVAPHEVETLYLGWTGDGHFGRLNLTHAFYQVLGSDDRNPLAGRAVDVNAQMAAAELSVDKDWLRFKTSVLWASGDSEPENDKARGFDSIMDAPIFAGGAFSYVVHQGIPIARAGVPLFNRMSLLPSLRDKLEGQANHVNPGLLLLNGGVVMRLTPKLKGSLDLSWFRFHRTEPLELLLHQPDIGRSFGIDLNAGFSWRPKLSDNIVVLMGGALFRPGGGYDAILSSSCDVPEACGASSGLLYQAFGELKLTY